MDQEQPGQQDGPHENLGEDQRVSFQPKPHRPKWLLPVIIAAALVLIAGGVAAYEIKHRQKPAQTTTNTTTQQAPITPATVSTNTDTPYTSNGNDLNLTFTYPSSWSITPQSGSNQTDQPITLTSPLVSIVGADGSSVTGKVIVKLRPVSASIDELAAGTATAAQASAQFAYTKPASTQHQYPYLTYISLKGKNANAGFEETMITGVTPFAKDQSVTSGSLGQLDPIITAEFFVCSTQTCDGSGETPLLISNDTWLNDATCKQVQAIFASLQLH